MKAHIASILVLVVCSFSTLKAQAPLSFELPQFNSEEDYKNFHDEVLNYVEWLETNPLDHEKRPQVNAIMMTWLEGTPTVTVAIQLYLIDYTEKNIDFLMLFMGGWSEYVINNPDQNKNMLKGNLAGVNAMLDYYSKGKKYGVKKDKNVEKLLKKRKAGELKQFISKRMYD